MWASYIDFGSLWFHSAQVGYSQEGIFTTKTNDTFEVRYFLMNKTIVYTYITFILDLKKIE